MASVSINIHHNKLQARVSKLSGSDAYVSITSVEDDLTVDLTIFGDERYCKALAYGINRAGDDVLNREEPKSFMDTIYPPQQAAREVEAPYKPKDLDDDIPF